METAEKNIAVYPEECSSNECKTSCQSTICQLCKNCLIFDIRLDLLRAHNEHLNKADCIRIFPPPMVCIIRKMLIFFTVAFMF